MARQWATCVWPGEFHRISKYTMILVSLRKGLIAMRKRVKALHLMWTLTYGLGSSHLLIQQ